jgi:hypothetical protein
MQVVVRQVEVVAFQTLVVAVAVLVDLVLWVAMLAVVQQEATVFMALAQVAEFTLLDKI